MRLSSLPILFCTSLLALASSQGATTIGPGSSPGPVNPLGSNVEELVLSSTLNLFYEGIQSLNWNGVELLSNSGISSSWAASDARSASAWLLSLPDRGGSEIGYLNLSQSITNSDARNAALQSAIERWLGNSERSEVIEAGRERGRGGSTDHEIAENGATSSSYYAVNQYRESTDFDFLIIPVIPEPSAALLCGLGALGLLRRRRDS